MSSTDVIRAWKDRTYRESLSAADRANLQENPAGLVDLSDIELDAVAGGTIVTVALSITCAVFCNPTKSSVCEAVCSGRCVGY